MHGSGRFSSIRDSAIGKEENMESRNDEGHDGKRGGVRSTRGDTAKKIWAIVGATTMTPELIMES